MNYRRAILFVFFGLSLLIIAGTAARMSSQPGADETTLIAGRNINMIPGTELPGGDPYLQRQNEPSIAASTRNPMRLLAGLNDYRTIDIPYPDKVPGIEIGQQAVGRDAWLGVCKSFNGGQSWTTTLLPGFPQDISSEGAASPLKLFGTAADPVVKAGTNGLFYYAGIAFNRVDRGSGVVFVARFIDLNNRENADTIKYDGVTIVDQGNAGQFLDKPWMAVDIPRAGHGHTTFPGQTEPIPCGNVYVAYSAFVGKTDLNIRSKMLFSRSVDCGRTWSAPIKLSETQHIDQGATIALDPASGALYVAWRRFATSSQGNAIVFVRSTNGGLTFSMPFVVHNLAFSFPASPDGPFDQTTTGSTFRTNSHPSVAVDHNGTVYLAWAERQSDKRSRIVLVYSTDGGSTWSSSPIPIDNSGVGHQFMPSLAYAGGKIVLTWYDQRNDIAGPASFTDFIEDSLLNNIRHTVDIRMAEIDPVDANNSSNFIHESKQVSRYLFLLDSWGDESMTLIQLQHNFTGLDMFSNGQVPFLGDYIDITPAPVFVPDPDGEWRYNTDSTEVSALSASPKRLLTTFHIAWEDTRDVKFPPGTGRWPDWSKYRAPTSTQNYPGFPSPTNSQYCDYAGLMNQNVYTSCLSQGFVASSPGNTKPLTLEGATDSNGFPIARAFAVTVKNMTDDDKILRLTIDAPPGVIASFVQYFDVDPNGTFPNIPGFPVDELAVAVAAQSSISRPVFVYPFSDPKASVKVHVTEDATSLTSIVTLNPDPTSPEIVDPEGWDPANPHIKGFEVHNPHIKGNAIDNKTQTYLINPHIKGLDPTQRDMINSDTATPHIKGDVLNPHIKGTDVEAPHIKGTSISEITWDVTNEGNTTTPYTFDILTTYASPNTDDPNAPDFIPPEEAIQFQLLIYKVYKTPVAQGCALAEEEHHELLANIPNPHIKGPHIKGSPLLAASVPVEDVKKPTFWLNPAEMKLQPKEKVLVKLWAIDPKLGNGDDFSFGPTGTDFTNANTEAEVTSQAHNTEDLEDGNYELPVAASKPLAIINDSLGNAIVGIPYSQTLMAVGNNPPYAWSWTGALPPGLSLDPNTGTISGTPQLDHVTYPHLYSFTIRVTDHAGAFVDKGLSISITVSPVLIDCPDGAQGGDFIWRGFYVPSYPGSSLDIVELYIGNANIPGDHTIRLTAYSGSYAGQVIGTATTTATLSSTDHNPVYFYFQGASIQQGSLVAFKMELISSPPGTLYDPYFIVSTCGLNDPNCTTGCPVIETDDTTPPLSVFRRNGIKIRIFGQ